MSTFEQANTELSWFDVTSDPTVQITIYDATHVVRGQAEGSLQLELPPGLYRVHFERGGIIHKEIVDHERSTTLQHVGPPLRSPVPFAGAVTSHEYYTQSAVRYSIEDTGPALGNPPHTSRLFVFLRRVDRDAHPRTLPSEPLTIHDVHGRLLTTISRTNATVDDKNGYVAYSTGAAAGTYRIRAARSCRDVAITIPAGRAAHVFIADTGNARLEDLRVSLVPIAAPFAPKSPIWAAMESAIAALHAPSRALPAAARVLLPGSVDQDLCSGIVAAHLLRRSGEREIFTEAMKRLRRYHEIPDVVVLDQLDTSDHPRSTLPDIPPLLRTSLVLSMTRTEIDSQSIAPNSVLAQVARRRFHDSVWCTWSARTWDERWIEPTVERLRAQDRHRDVASIASSLALPPQTIQQTLRALDAMAPGSGEPRGDTEHAVPGYTLGSVLGRNVRSIVYRAVRLENERQVALKLIPLRGGAAECARLHRDLDRLEPIKHPQIVGATARGTLLGNTGIWLEMELCRGSALDLLSEVDAPLSVAEARRLILEALAGLAQLHDRGVAHGGIKPENLLVREGGSGSIAGTELMTYWASATELDTALAFRFTPPELLVSHAKPQFTSDIWSIAATLYFLLTLEFVRDEYSGQSQLEAARDNPIISIAMRRPDLPEYLATCIDRALSSDRDTRPTNAHSFRDLLASSESALDAEATIDSKKTPDIVSRRAFQRGGQIVSRLTPTTFHLHQRGTDQVAILPEDRRVVSDTDTLTLSLGDEFDDTGAPPRPARVGRYEICESLGAGAMGVVYRARDPYLDRDVAIKLVRGNSATGSSGIRLLREAQTIARLRHPNVLPIFDVGPADGAVFVAMPLVEGGTLRSWLHDRSRSFDAILDRFVAAGRGLAAAHAAGLVHRDFKPDNVLLGADGEVHVADFSLARRVDGNPTPDPDGRSSGEWPQIGHRVGTPAYMAPEQLRGLPSDPRADQFSFCVALWEGLYGERPFSGRRPKAPGGRRRAGASRSPPLPATRSRSTTSATSTAIVESLHRLAPGTDRPLDARLDAIAAGPTPPARRDRPAWIAPLLTRGLAVDPDRRWPSMQALLDAIAKHRRHRRWPWWVAGGLGAIGLAAVISIIARPAPSPPFRLNLLTHHSDFTQAAISPDGSRLAVVAGDKLVIRGVEPDIDERTIVDHGIADERIAWSPDGRHLLAAVVPEIATRIETEMIDADGDRRFKLPMPGMAAFLSSAEFAVTSFRQRSVAIYPVREGATALTTCNVPGDYTFIWALAGLPDGTMIVETEKAGAYALTMLRRDCTVRATFSAEPISSFAVSDAGTVVAMVAGDGFGEILELSLDAKVISRRRITGAPETILGRHHGIDYVSTLVLKTHLDQVHGGQLQRRFSVDGGASFSLAPDGKTMAWIDLDGRSGGRGRLRISTLQDLPQRGRTILNDALLVGWSPDGRSLAVLVDERPEARIVVVDRFGTVLRRLPLQHLARAMALVWLNDHRIAAQTEDRTTYRWFDLDTGEQGEVVDSAHGSTYWLTRSPRDGTLAMWRNGTPVTNDDHPEHLWIQPTDHPARPLQVAEAIRHYLVPSWSPSGELLLRALETGQVWRVALDTGELTPIAQLPRTPMSRVFDDHLMTLADGDLLAVDVELGINVVAVVPDDDPRPRSPTRPSATPR